MKVRALIPSVLYLLGIVGTNAQTFDHFGGVVTYANGSTAPVASGHPNTQSATCSQSGTTQTCTVTDASKFKAGEPMAIAGTSTGMDWVFNGARADAGASLVTNVAGNTLTLTAPGSRTVAATAGTIRPARFYIANIAGGPRFVTPENHWMFGVAMGAATTAAVSTKYGNNVCTAAQDEFLQFAAWNFNSIALESDATYDPSASGSCSSNTRRPYHNELMLTHYAADNLTGGSWTGTDQAAKDLNNAMGASYTANCYVRRPILDYYDSRWSTYISGFMPGYNSDVNNWAASPFVMGLLVDDTAAVQLTNAGPEFHTVGLVGHNDCHPGLAVLITSPQQTMNNYPMYGSNNPFLYSDSKVYSKVAMASPPATCSLSTPCSLRDFAAKKYGTISALNTAWGTSYTTFDSSETVVASESWGTGNGSTKTFAHTFAHTTVTPFSVQISVAGVLKGGDCPDLSLGGCSPSAGHSSIIGTGISSGDINRSTGVASITFAAAPANGAAITVRYTYGGWSAGGTGLMDESGASASVGTNYVCATAMPAYATSHAYAINDIVLDATSGSWQIATTVGTSGSSRPAFSATQGVKVTDGGVIWSSIGNPVCGAGGDFPAANANATLGADMDEFSGQLAAQYMKSTGQAIKALYPDWLYWGPDELGVWETTPRREAAQAAQVWSDVLYTYLVDPTADPNGTDKYRFVTQFYTGPLYDYTNYVTTQDEITTANCNTNFPCYSTQAARGAGWYSLLNWMNTQKSYNGTYQWAGTLWWGSHNFQSSPFGLKTTKDNSYDGHENVTASVACSSPLTSLTCGGETSAAWNGTNGILGAGMIQPANALWHQVGPVLPSGGNSTQGSVSFQGKATH